MSKLINVLLFYGVPVVTLDLTSHQG